MSMRRSPAQKKPAELMKALEAATAVAQRPDPIEASRAFEQLCPVEQAAGSLGVSPDEWKPIKFMNDKHFETLKASHALDETLVRRIEAYKKVSASA